MVFLHAIEYIISRISHILSYMFFLEREKTEQVDGECWFYYTGLKIKSDKIIYFNILIYLFLDSFICSKVVFFKVNSGKVNYFSMFGSVIKNKLKNIFQYLVVL
jgi:hypothetical protein